MKKVVLNNVYFETRVSKKGNKFNGIYMSLNGKEILLGFVDKAKLLDLVKIGAVKVSDIE